LVTVFVTGGVVVVGAGFGVVVTGAGTVVVGSEVDGAVVLVARSAATAIFGVADGAPDEHAAKPIAAMTTDRPTTILCMRTATPSPIVARVDDGARCQWLLLI
jgi:hypothetical protein